MNITRTKVAPNLYRDDTTKVYYGRRERGGKTQWENLKTTNRDQANVALAAWLRGTKTLDADAGKFTIGALVDAWLTTKSSLSPKSADDAKCAARVFRATFEGGMQRKVRDIRARELVAWINHEANERDWTETTFNDYRVILRDMFEIAIANLIIETSPFSEKQIPRRKPSRVSRHIPTPEQFYAIIENVRAQNGGRHNGNGGQSADFLRFLGEAGVGQAEAEDLTWPDLGKTHIRFVRRKTDVEFSVPLYRYADGEPCLFDFVAELRAKKHDAHGPVFHIADPTVALRNACKRLRFRHFSPRNLRQFCIVRLLQKGMSFKDVSKWQGHNDGGVLIAKVYAWVKSDNDDAIEQRNLSLLRGGAAPVK